MARLRKEQVAVIYGEPEASQFIEALQRIKRLRQRKEKQTKTAKQKLRAALRKGRE